MKTIFSKTVLACSVAAASLFATAAHADPIFNPFTVTHTEGATTTTFVADKITGNYVEVATFTPTSATAGTFAVSLYWRAGQFVTGGGTSAYDASESRLGIDYGMYALYHSTGNFTIAGGKTVFNFTPGTGSLQVYLDEMVNSRIPADGSGNAPSGSGNFTVPNTGDDILIATGNGLAGQGTLDPSLPTCTAGGGSGINCGSFGSTTSFSLVSPGGPLFFTAPVPFFDLSFQSGQFNNFSPTGTQTINGSLDVVFGRVPEPSTTALFGLGLLGLGLSVRRRKQS